MSQITIWEEARLEFCRGELKLDKLRVFTEVTRDWPEYTVLEFEEHDDDTVIAIVRRIRPSSITLEARYDV